MVFGFAAIGGMAAIRAGHAFASTVGSKFLRGPLIQGGQFGVGYTTGAYGGYGVTNTADPFGIHKPKYKYTQMKLGMPYGGYGYRRRRYGSRYRYRSRYGYRRRSYYRRRYY